MIRLHNLSKSYLVNGVRTVVADGLNATFETRGATALLGRNGAGKSSLLRMIAGTMDPDDGQIVKTGRVSWPVGFAGSFHGDLSGAQNARFIARVQGVDTDEMLDAVARFTGLGAHFHTPVKTYSAGMRARLAFAVSMAIPFDTYLVDEVTSVGDAEFKRKSEALFHERLQHSGAIIVTHALGLVQRLCDKAAVLDHGRLTFYTDIDQAIRHHQDLCRSHG
ncbi:MAG: ABC transporter ATP-binding protein [Rhodovulum sp.]|jgi:capsular polysaccharide transport system ATP-binding protein|nr:ABC transporter ATP-binding protein [Rhodovulum sp.]MCI5086980.1 ABC transporter ATP-binding protein [Rhodovulum sp.]